MFCFGNERKEFSMDYVPRRSENDEEYRHRRRPRRTALDRFGMVALLLLLIASAVLAYRLYASQMLSSTWLYISVGVLALINILHMIVQFPLRYNKLGKLLCGLLAIPLAAVMLYASIATGSIQDALSKISGMLTEKDVTSVIVMADDPAQTLRDAVDYTFGYLENADEQTLQKVKDEIGYHVDTVSYANPTELANALYSGEVGAVIMNQAYTSVLERNASFKDFAVQTRVIYEFTQEQQMDSNKTKKLDINRPFVVYCSGIDARQSDINAKSLSDVNILAVVNPQTHQILLINTPRDYYLPLNFNGEMDKLTHAGLYGMEESMKVLSDLYSIDISYYVRVNFTGLVNIVDALGGVDVYSDYEFTTNTMEIPDETGEDFYMDSYYFSEGTNHLDGRAALAYSRERYSFADGDVQRGRNQMAVIKAIIDKATSPTVLSNYRQFLDAVSDAFITNLTYDDIAALVKMQQDNMQNWNISSFSVTGEGGTEYTYSGDYAFVMYPDTDLVNEAKDMISKIIYHE